MAAAGLGSRRSIEEWIRAGRVTLNGRVALLGARAGPRDRIAVDGVPVGGREEGIPRRVILYHKPVGELVTRHDPGGRPTVFERLPVLRSGKWISIGRLDYNTSGLLLFTSDGELANLLMHPRYAVEREYAVRVQGSLTPEQLDRLRQGILLDKVRARFESIEPAGAMTAAGAMREREGANRWYRATLTEGRNREVRRLIESVGPRVSRLIRIRYGQQVLPRDLPAGNWRELSARAIAALERVAREPKIR